MIPLNPMHNLGIRLDLASGRELLAFLRLCFLWAVGVFRTDLIGSIDSRLTMSPSRNWPIERDSSYGNLGGVFFELLCQIQELVVDEIAVLLMPKRLLNLETDFPFTGLRL